MMTQHLFYVGEDTELTNQNRNEVHVNAMTTANFKNRFSSLPRMKPINLTSDMAALETKRDLKRGRKSYGGRDIRANVDCENKKNTKQRFAIASSCLFFGTDSNKTGLEDLKNVDKCRELFTEKLVLESIQTNNIENVNDISNLQSKCDVERSHAERSSDVFEKNGSSLNLIFTSVGAMAGGDINNICDKNNVKTEQAVQEIENANLVIGNDTSHNENSQVNGNVSNDIHLKEIIFTKRTYDEVENSNLTKGNTSFNCPTSLNEIVNRDTKKVCKTDEMEYKYNGIAKVEIESEGVTCNACSDNTQYEENDKDIKNEIDFKLYDHQKKYINENVDNDKKMELIISGKEKPPDDYIGTYPDLQLDYTNGCDDLASHIGRSTNSEKSKNKEYKNYIDIEPGDDCNDYYSDDKMIVKCKTGTQNYLIEVERTEVVKDELQESTENECEEFVDKKCDTVEHYISINSHMDHQNDLDKEQNILTTCNKEEDLYMDTLMTFGSSPCNLFKANGDIEKVEYSVSSTCNNEIENSLLPNQVTDIFDNEDNDSTSNLIILVKTETESSFLINTNVKSLNLNDNNKVDDLNAENERNPQMTFIDHSKGTCNSINKENKDCTNSEEEESYRNELIEVEAINQDKVEITDDTYQPNGEGKLNLIHINEELTVTSGKIDMEIPNIEVKVNKTDVVDNVNILITEQSSTSDRDVTMNENAQFKADSQLTIDSDKLANTIGYIIEVDDINERSDLSLLYNDQLELTEKIIIDSDSKEKVNSLSNSENTLTTNDVNLERRDSSNETHCQHRLNEENGNFLDETIKRRDKEDEIYVDDIQFAKINEGVNRSTNLGAANVEKVESSTSISTNYDTKDMTRSNIEENHKNEVDCDNNEIDNCKEIENKNHLEFSNNEHFFDEIITNKDGFEITPKKCKALIDICDTENEIDSRAQLDDSHCVTKEDFIEIRREKNCNITEELICESQVTFQNQEPQNCEAVFNDVEPLNNKNKSSDPEREDELPDPYFNLEEHIDKNKILRAQKERRIRSAFSFILNFLSDSEDEEDSSPFYKINPSTTKDSNGLTGGAGSSSNNNNNNFLSEREVKVETPCTFIDQPSSESNCEILQNTKENEVPPTENESTVDTNDISNESLLEFDYEDTNVDNKTEAGLISFDEEVDDENDILSPKHTTNTTVNVSEIEKERVNYVSHENVSCNIDVQNSQVIQNEEIVSKEPKIEKDVLNIVDSDYEYDYFEPSQNEKETSTTIKELNISFQRHVNSELDIVDGDKVIVEIIGILIDQVDDVFKNVNEKLLESSDIKSILLIENEELKEQIDEDILNTQTLDGSEVDSVYNKGISKTTVKMIDNVENEYKNENDSTVQIVESRLFDVQDNSKVDYHNYDMILETNEIPRNKHQKDSIDHDYQLDTMFEVLTTSRDPYDQNSNFYLLTENEGKKDNNHTMLETESILSFEVGYQLDKMLDQNCKTYFNDITDSEVMGNIKTSTDTLLEFENDDYKGSINDIEPLISEHVRFDDYDLIGNFDQLEEEKVENIFFSPSKQTMDTDLIIVDDNDEIVEVLDVSPIIKVNVEPEKFSKNIKRKKSKNDNKIYPQSASNYQLIAFDQDNKIIENSVSLVIRERGNIIDGSYTKGNEQTSSESIVGSDNASKENEELDIIVTNLDTKKDNHKIEIETNLIDFNNENSDRDSNRSNMSISEFDCIKPQCEVEDFITVTNLDVDISCTVKGESEINSYEGEANGKTQMETDVNLEHKIININESKYEKDIDNMTNSFELLHKDQLLNENENDIVHEEIFEDEKNYTDISSCNSSTDEFELSNRNIEIKSNKTESFILEEFPIINLRGSIDDVSFEAMISEPIQCTLENDIESSCFQDDSFELYDYSSEILDLASSLIDDSNFIIEEESITAIDNKMKDTLDSINDVSLLLDDSTLLIDDSAGLLDDASALMEGTTTLIHKSTASVDDLLASINDMKPIVNSVDFTTTPVDSREIVCLSLVDSFNRDDDDEPSLINDITLLINNTSTLINDCTTLSTDSSENELESKQNNTDIPIIRTGLVNEEDNRKRTENMDIITSSDSLVFDSLPDENENNQSLRKDFHINFELTHSTSINSEHDTDSSSEEEEGYQTVLERFNTLMGK